MMLGKCEGCKKWKLSIKNRRMNTQYNDEESNYIVCCKTCFDEVQADWREMWADYYSGCM